MDRKKTKIGYKIGFTFEDEVGDICFQILFPHIYTSFEEAEKNDYRMSANMEKQEDGKVIIVLYEDGAPVETICWDDWWKYKCFHVKEDRKDLDFHEARTDYEPYSENFEKIFDYFCKNEIQDEWPMFGVSWIKPVIIIDD